MVNAATVRPVRQGSLNKEKVAQQFVKFYYNVLNDHPDYLYQFYGAGSTVVVSEAQDIEEPITVDADTEEEIGKLLFTLFADVTVTVDTFFPQESIDGSVLLLVSGRMTRKGSAEERLFTQALLLARQDKGYYVRTDTLQVHSRGSSFKEAASQPAAPVTPRNVLSGAKGSLPGSHSSRTTESGVTEDNQTAVAEYAAFENGTAVQKRDADINGNKTGSGGGSNLEGDKVKEETRAGSKGCQVLGAGKGSSPVIGLDDVNGASSPDTKRDGEGMEQVEAVVSNGMPSVVAPVAGNTKDTSSKVVEKEMKDREVEPPSQLVAPIEKPVEAVPASDYIEATAASDPAPASTNERKSYAQALLFSAAKASSAQPAKQTVRTQTSAPQQTQATTNPVASEVASDHMAVPTAIKQNSVARGVESSGMSCAAEPASPRSHQSVFVCRLPLGTAPAKVRAALSVFGPLVEGAGGVKVWTRPNGCYACVTYQAVEAAERALNNTVEIDGETVVVEVWNPRPRDRRPRSRPAPQADARHVV